MRFFTYGRKSVYKDNSDSIDNQARMCRDYCEARFPGQIDSWTQFSDEDFSGATTARPDFQRMMSMIRDDMCDVLVVYQLDRFSRDVKDFSVAYTDLQAHHVRFICLDINVDTSTPIGEAMMYVSAAFGQMERKNIALRVADNLEGLARKGAWAGGKAPVGYVRSQIIVNGRKHVTLVPDPEGVKYMEWLFDQFLDNNYSLQKMETAFRHQGIKSRNGKFFSSTQLHQLLTSPYCCEATPEVYDYYASKGCQMVAPREKWDGTRGVMVYGRTTEREHSHQHQTPDHWIVCPGMHEPTMPADKWLSVQARFHKNIFDKQTKYDISLLKGVLRCSCGSLMAVARKKKVDGSASSWYYCNRRMRQGSEACSCIQIKTELLDQKVLDIFRQIESDPKLIDKYTSHDRESRPDPKKIQGRIGLCEDKLGKLAASLALAQNSTASKYIIAQIESLDAELQELKKQRAEAESAQKATIHAMASAAEKAQEIKRLIQGMDGFSADERNKIVKSIIKKCTWDGETLFILL